jgi:hypothetical protein
MFLAGERRQPRGQVRILHSSAYVSKPIDCDNTPGNPQAYAHRSVGSSLDVFCHTPISAIMHHDISTMSS